MGRTVSPSIEGLASGTRIVPRSLRTLREQCARNRRQAKKHSPSPQMSQRHTDRYQSRNATCTCWGAKSNQALREQGWNVRGRVSQLHLVPGCVSHRTSPTIPGGGHAAHTWHILVADDFLLEASEPYYKEALVLLQIAAVLEQDGGSGSCFSTAANSGSQRDAHSE